MANILYVSPIGRLITSHSVEYHQYADDIQIFTRMTVPFATALDSLQGCIESLQCTGFGTMDCCLIPTSLLLHTLYCTKRLCIFGPKGAIQIRYYYYYLAHRAVCSVLHGRLQ